MNQAKSTALPRLPQQRRARARLESLSAAAEQLLRLKPYSEISVAELAAKAGVSPAYLYTRFSNKQGLLNYLIDEFLSAQKARAGRLLDSRRWQGVALDERLGRLANQFVNAADSHGGLIRAMSEMDDACADDAWMTDAAGGDLCDWLMECRDEIRHPQARQAVIFVLQIFTLGFQTRQFLGGAHPARNLPAPEVVRMASLYLKAADPVPELAQGDLEND